MSAAEITAWAEVLKAVGAIAGAVAPAAAAVWIANKFHKQISDVLPRLTKGKGKLLGSEFEVELGLDNLENLATKSTETGVLPPGTEQSSQLLLPAAEPTIEPSKPLLDSTAELSEGLDAIKYGEALSNRAFEAILREATVNPQVGLMRLAHELDREANRVVDQLGFVRSVSKSSVHSNVSLLVAAGLMSPLYQEAIDSFWIMRSVLLHSGTDANINDRDLLRALDSGLKLLRALYDVPRYAKFVVEPCVELFSDAEGFNRLEDFHGVVLSDYTNPQLRNVFPTRRSDYHPGSYVSWAFNFSQRFDKCWYRDSVSGEIYPAWDGSTEFTGCNIEDFRFSTRP